MFNVLIVDDNQEKIIQLKYAIEEFGDEIEVDYEMEVKKACTKLECKYFDLVILDVQLPSIEHKDGIATKGGLQILDMIWEIDAIKKPAHIIGLTAFDDNFEEIKSKFDDKLWHLIKYDKSSSGWKDCILGKVEYLILARESLEKNMPKKNEKIRVDCAIMTAVDCELNAVLKSGIKWEKYQREGDPTTYYYAKYKVHCETINLLLVKQNQMGMPAASMLTTKIIETFSPRLICMVGITGGRKGEVNLGDIIVASESWDYGSGKIKPKEEGNGLEFCPETHRIGISALCKECLSEDFSTELYRIRKEWNESNGKCINHDIEVHVGALVSGASVVQDERIIIDYILPQNRKILGVDMETYGVYYAAENAYNKKITYLSIKAVSDYANCKKNDDYQQYSAFVSFQFFLSTLCNIWKRI